MIPNNVKEATKIRDDARAALERSVRVDVHSFHADLTMSYVSDLIKAEGDLQIALIGEWLDGAPARMKEQGERGVTSLSPLYDAGQLAAVEATAKMLRSGDWARAPRWRSA